MEAVLLLGLVGTPFALSSLVAWTWKQPPTTVARHSLTAGTSTDSSEDSDQ